MSIPVEHDQERAWDWPLQANDEFAKLIDDDEHFEVGLDAKYFTPKEIEVKAIGDLVEIHLEHKLRRGEEDPFGMISRSITRCYKLPEGVDAKTLKSNLDNNGILHISGQKKH